MITNNKITGWHNIISLFTPSVQSDFLGLLRPLSSLFKPVTNEQNEGPGHPDGIDGIANKGSYQDLLLSEWALLDEIPDEFERRFVMSEHLFVSKKKAEQTRHKMCVVLFDTGSNQFGSPKLGQLLLLILLWRRALQGGATFRFGALQHNEWFNDGTVDEVSIQKLIDARYPGQVNDQHSQFWQQQLSNESQDSDNNGNSAEIWTVSNKQQPTMPFATGHIVIEEKPFAQPPTLIFTVGNKTFELKMPSSATQLRMIRNPFKEPEIVSPAELTQCQVFGFSTNGNRLLMLDSQNMLHTYQLPSKKRQGVKNIAPLNLGDQPLALCFTKKNIIRLIAHANRLRVIDLPKTASIDFGHNQHLAVSSKRIFDSMLYVHANSHEQKLYILDIKNNLRMVLLNHERPILNTIATDIVKLGRIKSISYFIQYEATCLTIKTFIERTDAPQSSFSYGQFHRPTVFIHDSGVWRINSIGCLAYQLTSDTWALVCNNEQTECNLNKGVSAIGVVVLDAKTSSIALVCLSANRRLISLCDQHSTVQEFETEQPILKIQMNPSQRRVVYTHDGINWLIYDIDSNEVIHKIKGQS